MQVNARFQYIFDVANDRWIPHTNVVAGGASTTLVNQDGNALVANFNTSQDAVNATSPLLGVSNFAYAFNGTTWDRIRSAGNNADALANLALGVQNVNDFLRVYNGTTWDRARGAGNNADGVVNLALGILNANDFLRVYNGATWDRARSSSTSTIGSLSSFGGLLATPPGNWSHNHNPATNVQATVTRAAAVAQRNVCTSICATVSDPTGLIDFDGIITVRDGISGAGTILLLSRVFLKSDGADVTGHHLDRIALTGLNLVGSVNTAMTLEFSSAAGAGTRQSVTLSGYTTG